MKMMFEQADKDGSGELNREELEDLFFALDLGLSESDVLAVVESADADGDGSVKWVEFMGAAERMVKNVFGLKDWSTMNKSPWVKLKGTNSPYDDYFYNRESGQSEWFDAHDPEGQELRLANFRASPAYLKQPPSLLEHMHQLFKIYDSDASGELEWAEFWRVLDDLDLGLTEEEIGQWQLFADADGSGTVKWCEFKPTAARLLKQVLNQPLPDGVTDPWVAMSDPNGHEYRFNRQTGKTEWVVGNDANDNAAAADEGYFNGEGEPNTAGGGGASSWGGGATGGGGGKGDGAPSLAQQLKVVFEKFDTDGSGELEWGEFWYCLTDLNLGLSDDDIADIQEKADLDKDGEPSDDGGHGGKGVLFQAKFMVHFVLT
jgi:Ca2+-binding EF-hand superfamily protein